MDNAAPTRFPLCWPDTMPIPGFPGYVVSPEGKVLSLRRGSPKVLREDPDKDGYPCVLVVTPRRRRRLAVHRAVALAYLGAPQAGQEVRHLDGKKSNSTPDNLIWGTQLENAADRERHGRTARGLRNGAHTKPERRPRGPSNGKTKATPEIRKAVLEADGRQSDIGKRFGISQQLVSLIKVTGAPKQELSL